MVEAAVAPNVKLLLATGLSPPELNAPNTEPVAGPAATDALGADPKVKPALAFAEEKLPNEGTFPPFAANVGFLAIISSSLFALRLATVVGAAPKLNWKPPGG